MRERLLPYMVGFLAGFLLTTARANPPSPPQIREWRYDLKLWNMTYGTPVPNSQSPDKRCFLLETFMTDGQGDLYCGTTSYGVLLLAADRSKIFAVLPIGTVNDTDIPYEKRLTLLWSHDSTRLAFHDSSKERHSKLSYYLMTGERFEPLAVPDLLEALCQSRGLKREQLASSCQIPAGWRADGALMVEVSAKLKNGGKENARFALPLSGANVVTVEKLAR